ncbi:hypothetical protein TNCV_1798761 [Trichonephila clavipes]|uniref:Uncharacterized protein n=1 Tax=Trichonephila clavipes TaxID=2585209 RepID=A0A8X6VH26_TRICX|nr:hypothetical protein TNCV_1798761 [Trichonephila clavipes]
MLYEPKPCSGRSPVLDIRSDRWIQIMDSKSGYMIRPEMAPTLRLSKLDMDFLGNERADWLAKAATKRKIDIAANILKSFYKKIMKEKMSWNQEYLISNKGDK